MSARCFYFGCWNRPGHYLFVKGGSSVRREDERQLVYFGGELCIHLDATLAPKRGRAGGIVWDAMDRAEEYAPRRRSWNSAECPQGQFLRHELDTGFTAIQWWDRCQGDKRGACNSTILLEGRHTSAEMLAALAEHFPNVLENLTRAGVILVDVTPAVEQADV